MTLSEVIKAARLAGADDAMIVRMMEALDEERTASRRQYEREKKRRQRAENIQTRPEDNGDNWDKKETPPTPPKEKNISHTRTREAEPVAEPTAEQFRQAWAAWPAGQGRNCGEPGACRAWIAQAQAGADPAEMLAACQAYARKADPEYALDFANFMQRQTWREWLPRAAPGVDWAGRLASFAKSKIWAPSWGPEPGMSGCKAPADALRAAGFQAGPLAERGAA